MIKLCQSSVRISLELLSLVRAYASQHGLDTSNAARQLIEDALNPPMPIECLDTLVNDLLAEGGLEQTLKLMQGTVQTIYDGTMPLKRAGRTSEAAISEGRGTLGFRYSESLCLKINEYARAHGLDISGAVRELLSLGLKPSQPMDGLKHIVLGWASHGIPVDVASQRLEGYIRVKDISRQNRQPGWWHEAPSYRASKE